MTAKVIQTSKNIINQYSNLPSPAEPDWGGEFSFPVAADNLSDVELDNWMLRLGAWRGYVSSELSELESRISIIEPAFELKVGTVMAETPLPSDRRTVKEIVRILAIQGNDELMEIQGEVFQLKAAIKLLRGKLDFYTTQFEAISRVVSRRGQERVRLS